MANAIAQFFRLLIHAAGLYASIPLGVITGIVIDGVALHSTVAPGLTGVPHPSTWILGGVVAGLIGGVLIEKGKSAPAYYATIGARTALLIAWWVLLRLACLHPHGPTSIALSLLVLVALSAVWPTLRGLLRGDSRADTVAYALVALSLVGYGVFLQGDRVLELRRNGDSVDGELITHRWLGAIETDRTKLRGVTGSEYLSFVDEIDNVLGDGVALFTADGPVPVMGDPVYFHTIGYQFGDRFDEIEEGAIDSLTLREPIPFARLPWTIAAAGALVLLGRYWDPVSIENRRFRSADHDPTPHRMPIATIARGAAVVALLVGVAWGVLKIGGAIWQRDAQLAQIAEIAGEAELADFEFDGQVVVGNVWRIATTRAGFGDADLAQLKPLLDEWGVVDLDLSGTGVTDAGVATLRWTDSLVAYRLRGAPITAAALPDIGHTNPWLLDLRDTPIRAGDLAALPTGNLQYLLITDPGFERRDFGELVRFERLKHARVEGAEISQEDLDFWADELADITIEGARIVADAEVAGADAFAEIAAAGEGDTTVPDGPIQEGPIVETVRRYVEAIGRRDTFALKSVWDRETPSSVSDLTDDWWEIRPVRVVSFTGDVRGGLATLEIMGETADGTTVPWGFELVPQAGEWRVRREWWIESGSF